MTINDWASLVIPAVIAGLFAFIGILAKGALQYLNDERNRAATSQTAFIDYLKSNDEKNQAHADRMETGQRDEREAWRLNLQQHTDISKEMHRALMDLTSEYKAHHANEEKQQQLVIAAIEDNTTSNVKLMEFLQNIKSGLV